MGEGVSTLQAHLKDMPVINQPVPPAAKSGTWEGKTVIVFENVDAEFPFECVQTVARLGDDEAGGPLPVAGR